MGGATSFPVCISARNVVLAQVTSVHFYFKFRFKPSCCVWKGLYFGVALSSAGVNRHLDSGFAGVGVSSLLQQEWRPQLLGISLAVLKWVLVPTLLTPDSTCWPGFSWDRVPLLCSAVFWG